VSLSLTELADRLAISDVLVRYGTAMDTRSWSLLDECFTPDAVLDYDTSGVFHGVAEFVEHADAGLRRIKSTQHYVVNHVVTLDGDHATATSYALAQHVHTAGDGLFSLGGVYHDDLVRTASGWRIERRRFVSSWSSGELRSVAASHG